MKTNKIYITSAGGNFGCTEPIYQAMPDFILHVNDKSWMFNTDKDGNLTMLCINGKDADFGVIKGYKAITLKAVSSDYDDYEKSRHNYEESIKECKGRCSCLAGTLSIEGLNTGTIIGIIPITERDLERREMDNDDWDCPFAVTGSLLYDPFCLCTGGKFTMENFSTKLDSCPFHQ